MYLIILTILIFFNSIIFSEAPIEYKKFINFTHQSEKGEFLQSEDYSGYNELNRWALFQGLKLAPDNPMYGLKDGICKMIPSSGFKFFLTTDPGIKKPLYIYLDLTTYSNLNNSKFPERYLKIFVNEQLKQTIYFENSHLAKNPTVLSIDPVEFRSGRIDIKFVPDSILSGRFWGIWDVFYSYEKEQNLD